MAYNDYELSVDDSQPDELFEFLYRGDNSYYRVTSSAFPVTHVSNIYSPEAIKRGNIKRTSEIGKNSMKINVSRGNAHFARYIAGSLTYDTEVTIYTLQPDASYISAWKGVIKSVFKTKQNITITCEPISTSASRPILHRKYQIQCPHKLGDYYCGVNLVPFTKNGTLDAVSGTTLSSSTFATEADGWFNGGTITIDGEKRTIRKHVGANITLLDAFFDAKAGDSFAVIAGCSHDIATCKAKFSNELNYGGCPWIPSSDDIQKGRGFTY
jgi:uncharacterized phage protein (TIGR02218 family)